MKEAMAGEKNRNEMRRISIMIQLMANKSPNGYEAYDNQVMTQTSTNLNQALLLVKSSLLGRIRIKQINDTLHRKRNKHQKSCLWHLQFRHPMSTKN